MTRHKSISTAALVVALLALVASLGGGSFAAGLINSGDIKNNSITGKDVKKNSLKGNDIKNGTIQGKDVKDGSLGDADLGADVLSSTMKTVRVGATGGADFASARAAAPEQALFTKAPFTVYGKCFTDNSGPTTYVYTYIRTTANGAVLDSDDSDYSGGSVTDFLNTDTAEDDRSLTSTSAGTDSSDFYKNNFGANAADGTAIGGLTNVGAKNGNLAGGNGAFLAGNSCIFSTQIFSS